MIGVMGMAVTRNRRERYGTDMAPWTSATESVARTTTHAGEGITFNKEVPMKESMTPDDIKQLLEDNGMDLSKPYESITNDQGHVIGYKQADQYMNKEKSRHGRFVYADTNLLRAYS